MSNELYHHGVKGMRWGIRRYQNPDGTRIYSRNRKKANDIYKTLSDKEKYYVTAEAGAVICGVSMGPAAALAFGGSVAIPLGIAAGTAAADSVIRKKLIQVTS